MDESTFETFEEELGKPLQEAPPQKPVRQTRTGGRAEMYAQRRVREPSCVPQESPNVQQVPKMIAREHPLTGATSLRRTLSIQNLTQFETPWEGVTLNRCLIAAVTILLLSSGLQRIHEAVRGRRDASEEIAALNERHALIKRGKVTPHEPDTSLWETFFWWIDDDDDDEKSKRGTRGRGSRGLRHRALPDLRLLKKRETKFTERRRRERHEVDENKEKLTKEKEIKVKKKVKEVKAEKDTKKAAKESKPTKKGNQ
ncbi:uncharacterized protein LOC122357451 isoform X2 [Puntigrus tetrazona]|uniref:uncharacterized protein LOC122357451 isoform X2 n=1 Tax=Puntigrus tetrazona TaxID=1606681 RepID=UPI001C899B55|nr:uncharacterized protein LOC122357451 isoform X2 [Puntigrus tetrazona]